MQSNQINDHRQDSSAQLAEFGRSASAEGFLPTNQGATMKKLTLDEQMQDRWNRAEKIINAIKMALQYPEDGPEDLDFPDSLEEIENFQYWAGKLEDLAGELCEESCALYKIGQDAEIRFESQADDRGNEE